MTQMTGTPFPRWPLLGIGGMVLSAILFAGTARYTEFGAARPAQPVIIASLDLWFDPQADGTALVRNAADQSVLEKLPADGSGFIRGVMRALLRERKIHGKPADAPFRLVQQADFNIVIFDSATGTRMGLNGFGPTNVQAFGQLIARGQPALKTATHSTSITGGAQ
jgi:putative photosynthetic complex assembly protein